MSTKTTVEEYDLYPFASPSKFEPVLKGALPSPHELAQMERKSKVTITLNDESIAFFKQQARKYNTPYQAMIRNLLQQYAQQSKDS